MPGKLQEGKYLDEEVEMTVVVIAARGSVVPCDILASDIGLDHNMLADGKAKDVTRTWQAKAVSGLVPFGGSYLLWIEIETDMAVFGEMTIFFTSGNSFHSLADNAFLLSRIRRCTQQAG
jgi:hypothetical protein